MKALSQASHRLHRAHGVGLRDLTRLVAVNPQAQLIWVRAAWLGTVRVGADYFRCVCNISPAADRQSWVKPLFCHQQPLLGMRTRGTSQIPLRHRSLDDVRIKYMRRTHMRTSFTCRRYMRDKSVALSHEDLCPEARKTWYHDTVSRKSDKTVAPALTTWGRQPQTRATPASGAAASGCGDTS